MPVWMAAAIPQMITVAKTIVGALIAFILGRWIIAKLVHLTDVSLKRKRFDATLARYIVSLSSIALNIFLIIAILGIFGVDTTSFAALIAAAGLAIGAAWSGMMSNFAAGFFIILFHPFKVGDFVRVGGVTGTVAEIGMFAITIDTLDNVFTVVGNAKAAGEVIENFSRNPYRTVDLRGQLAHGVDPSEAILRLRPVIAAIPNVLKDPAPCIEILEFNDFGTLLVVRPFTNNAHYWQVYFDTNRAIAETFKNAAYPVPSQYQTEYEYSMAAHA
jgi:small conductance mechanosensitive channel